MNIYFSGSMTNSQEKMCDYKEIIDFLENYGNVLNKFVGEKIIDYDANFIYKRDTNNLRDADILIADITIPSTGVGFELGYAEFLNIKTILIYDKNKSKPSSLVLGNPNFVKIEYNSIEEVKQELADLLSK